MDLKAMIEEGRLELTDCSLEEGAILSENSNAMLVFHGTKDWGELQLSFSQAPLETTAIECYNSPSKEKEFSRYRREEGYILPDGKEAKIPLAAKNTGNLRPDIHGNFLLDSISVSKRVPAASLTPKMIFGHLNWVRMTLFLILGVLGLGRYGLERKQKSGYDRIGMNQSRRLVYMDGIRVLAAVMVVALHEIGPIVEGLPVGSGKVIILKILTVIFSNCNLLFAMISGALLLEWKKEGWGDFLKKRFFKVLLPLVVYGMFYLKGCSYSSTDLISWIRYGVETFASGNFMKGPHLWLIYVLIGLYFTVIPFRYMLGNMEESMKGTLLVLILLCLSINTIEDLTGKAIGISVFLGSWAGIFIMGYLVNQSWMRKYDRLLLGAGLVSFLASVWLVMIREDCMDNILGDSILSMLMSAAIFVIILHLDPILAPVGKILALASKYSYSIILIHWYIQIRVIHNNIFNPKMNQLLLCQPFLKMSQNN